jgi:hypothetical protein
MRRRWSKVVKGFTLAAILAVGFFTYRLLSPAGREAIEHHQCLRREEPRAEAVRKLIDSTLGEGKATRSDVRQFLDQNFANLPIHELAAQMSAGHMRFSFDQSGLLTGSVLEIPCPIL